METVRVADEVWIATALLHREHHEREAFSIGEIVARAAEEKLHTPLRPGVMIHASQHCVANKRPNPGTYRMLFASSDGQRRLFRHGDAVSPGRAGKIVPVRDMIPQRYWPLLDWYRSAYNPAMALDDSAQEPLPQSHPAALPTQPSAVEAVRNTAGSEEDEMTNSKRLMAYVRHHPGLDDDQLSEATDIRPRQQANIILRKLAKAGKVRRVKQLGAKIRNYPLEVVPPGSPL